MAPTFGRLVSRCLEKRPDDRMQTARDVYNELKSQQRETSASTTARPLTQPRVETARPPSSGADRTTGLWTTVLPFTARGDDADIIALAEGVALAAAMNLPRTESVLPPAAAAPPAPM